MSDNDTCIGLKITADTQGQGGVAALLPSLVFSAEPGTHKDAACVPGSVHGSTSTNVPSPECPWRCWIRASDYFMEPLPAHRQNGDKRLPDEKGSVDNAM